MIRRSRRDDIVPYRTKDGSEIRELLHPAQHAARNQSLAEASIPAGGRTQSHFHRHSEEIYHITRGTGTMTLGEETFAVEPGDSILIPPGTPHCLENTGQTALIVLCCCAPSYAHEDTFLLAGRD